MAGIANISLTLICNCEKENREVRVRFLCQRPCPTNRCFSYVKSPSRRSLRQHMVRLRSSGISNNSINENELIQTRNEVCEAELTKAQNGCLTVKAQFPPGEAVKRDTDKAREGMISESQETVSGAMQEDSSQRNNCDRILWKKVGKVKEGGDTIAMLLDSARSQGLGEEDRGRNGQISSTEWPQVLSAAVEGKNMELALSVLNAQKSSHSTLPQTRAVEQNEDVNNYATVIKGLAAALHVSDAINIVEHMSRSGVPKGEEVSFGKVINCPTCKKALAVVQPHHGIQLVPCSHCRYNYELMSGAVVSYKSDTLCNEFSVSERSFQLLFSRNAPAPLAVHTLVVQDPSGIARTARFATETVEIPAQEGERVTFALAAPAIAERQVGPFRMSMRTPRWRPSEPMAISNHVTGTVTTLLNPPREFSTGALFDNAFTFSALVGFALGEAATNFVDPSLPRLIAASAVGVLALKGAVDVFVYPRLNKIPQRTIGAAALRQQLLAEHESLEVRIKGLTQAAINEVRMMARMFQLQNKMEAVGEPAYNARIARVIKAREGIYQQLVTRLELIHRYAKVLSMIEIEVEMDVDVLAAEAAGAVERIMGQLEHVTEIDDLQEKWKLQAEASNEVERLLNLAPFSPN